MTARPRDDHRGTSVYETRGLFVLGEDADDEL